MQARVTARLGILAKSGWRYTTEHLLDGCRRRSEDLHQNVLHRAGIFQSQSHVLEPL